MKFNPAPEGPDDSRLTYTGERSPIPGPAATGMIFGLKGKSTRKHINRAALEAVGYSTLQHLMLFRNRGFRRIP